MKKHYIELREIMLSLPRISREKGEKECLHLLQDKLAELSAFRKTFDRERDKKEMGAFREIVLDIAHESGFLKYCYDKPRGYAGDYKSLEMIWYALRKGGTYRYSGKTELGKLLSSLTFKMDIPRATFHRMRYAKRNVKKSGLRIASIGCGSCVELWELNGTTMQNKDVFLLDQDEQAIERVKEKLKKKDIRKKEFIKENIHKFIVTNGKGTVLGQRDFIYLMGLLDYFSVRSSRKIVSALWEHVNPGGKLFFTNAHPDNPTRLWMEYVGDWHLLYKNEEEMYSIVGDLKNIENISLKKDQYNVFQYLEVIKK